MKKLLKPLHSRGLRWYIDWFGVCLGNVVLFTSLDNKDTVALRLGPEAVSLLLCMTDTLRQAGYVFW